MSLSTIIMVEYNEGPPSPSSKEQEAENYLVCPPSPTFISISIAWLGNKTMTSRIYFSTQPNQPISSQLQSVK